MTIKTVMLWFGLSLLIGSSFTNVISANEDATRNGNATSSGFHLLAFDLSQVSTFQAGRNSFSGELAWVPSFSLSNNLAVRGLLGGTPLKGAYGNFFAVEYELLLMLPIVSAVFTEIGAGAQTWTNRGTFPEGSVNVSWRFGQPVVRYLERISIGYTAIAVPDNLAHEIKLGIGF